MCVLVYIMCHRYMRIGSHTDKNPAMSSSRHCGLRFFRGFLLPQFSIKKTVPPSPRIFVPHRAISFAWFYPFQVSGLLLGSSCNTHNTHTPAHTAKG